MALTSVQGQRDRAKGVFSSPLRPSRAASVCCNSGMGLPHTQLGADISSPDSGRLYPASANLGGAELLRDCGDLTGFNLKLIPGANDSGTIKIRLVRPGRL